MKDKENRDRVVIVETVTMIPRNNLTWVRGTVTLGSTVTCWGTTKQSPAHSRGQGKGLCAWKGTIHKPASWTGTARWRPRATSWYQPTCQWLTHCNHTSRGNYWNYSVTHLFNCTYTFKLSREIYLFVITQLQNLKKIVARILSGYYLNPFPSECSLVFIFPQDWISRW